MLCTIVPWADAIYIFERTGKVKLIEIADHGADGADGQAAFSQQLCRPCHAVVQQEPPVGSMKDRLRYNKSHFCIYETTGRWYNNDTTREKKLCNVMTHKIFSLLL